MNDNSMYYRNFRNVPPFLPMSLEELTKISPESRNVDFIVVTGDAYVDHPSFGAALIGKLLWAQGFTVGIIAQPNWKTKDDFTVFGKPNLGFLVTGGNVDSMVNHYSVAKKKRDKDYYSPDSKTELRPDRATIVYSCKIREVYGKTIPIIIGGLEASLRRMAHYDYWNDKVRKSILIDSSADILVYGMGENQISEIAALLRNGADIKDIKYIKGTVYKDSDLTYLKNSDEKYIVLPDFEEINSNKSKYAESFRVQYENTGHINSKILVESYKNLDPPCFIIQNTPASPLSTFELDAVYDIFYSRKPHPSYTKDVPSIEEVQFSIISSRGCFGGCNFCALSFHQGRSVSARSHESILREAKQITALDNFKGYIHDVGGPTANFRMPSCDRQLEKGICTSKKCLAPKPCSKLNVSHSDYLDLLRKLRKLPKVKKVFVRSGIRYDYLIYDNDKSFFNELCEHHVSGQLKVAPEHVSDNVLIEMGKPSADVYDKFVKEFYAINERIGKKQFIVPYLMSSHPGSTIDDAIKLALYLRDNKISPEQVQDFYPTPGTVSTCTYYTGINPLTMKEVYVARSPHEKAMQRALIQYRLPQNYHLVLEALKLAKRTDLIGFGKDCLIRHREMSGAKTSFGKKSPPAKPKPEKPVQKKKTIRNVHKKKSKG